MKYCYKIVAEHAYLTKKKPSKFYIDNKVHYYGCRNTIMTQIKNWGVAKAIVCIPVNIAVWLGLAAAFVIKGRGRQAWALWQGVWWNVINLGKVLAKRKKVQTIRVVSDWQILERVGVVRGVGYYLGKGLAYVTGKAY